MTSEELLNIITNPTLVDELKDTKVIDAYLKKEEDKVFVIIDIPLTNSPARLDNTNKPKVVQNYYRYKLEATSILSNIEVILGAKESDAE